MKNYIKELPNDASGNKRMYEKHLDTTKAAISNPGRRAVQQNSFIAGLNVFKFNKTQPATTFLVSTNPTVGFSIPNVLACNYTIRVALTSNPAVRITRLMKVTLGGTTVDFMFP
jgi:hypothetical protein